MRKLGKWVVTLGILTTMPSLATAGPFDGFRSNKQQPTQTQNSARSNQAVAQDIAKVLKRARLNGKNIEIEFNNGYAKLTGLIADQKDKAAATKAVEKVRGVRVVDNQMVIMQGGTTPKLSSRQVPPFENNTRQNPFARQAQQPQRQNPFARQTAPRRDSQIQLAAGETGSPADNQAMADSIAKALGAAKLTGYDIQISYQNGTATLAGSVPTREQWLTAGQITSGVPGVQQVNNQLRLAAPAPRTTQAQPVSQLQPGIAPPPRDAGSLIPAPVAPPVYGQPGPGPQMPIYTQPNLPANTAWPATAAYPNSAQVSYPTQYSASAWPYIGPFYPYPQVPMGWRKAELEWDDGAWNLKFNSKTDRWWWFMNPQNW